MPESGNRIGKEPIQGGERSESEEKVEIVLSRENLEAMAEVLDEVAQDLLGADHDLFDAYGALNKGNLEQVRNVIERVHRVLSEDGRRISDNVAKVHGLSAVDHADDYWLESYPDLNKIRGVAADREKTN